MPSIILKNPKSPFERDCHMFIQLRLKHPFVTKQKILWLLIILSAVLLKTAYASGSYDSASDEINRSPQLGVSELKCRPKELKCQNGESCVPMSNFQDGIRDCADGSDEVCYKWQFDCGWGSPKCIMADQIKDGRIDCQSGVDEDCALNDFMCHDKKSCIASEKYQDGKKDCLDGSDETCRYNQFECKSSKACISMDQFQNGISDCFDGSDEECFNNEIKCAKGGLPVCVAKSQINDGRKDCANGEDEDSETKEEVRKSRKEAGESSEKTPKLAKSAISSSSKNRKKSENIAELFNTETYIGPSLLEEPLVLAGLDLPVCNLDNQGSQCAPNAICKIAEQGLPECICKSHSIFHKSFNRCIEVIEFPVVLNILKRNGKYLRFIDSYLDPSSNDFVELKALVLRGYQQLMANSEIATQVQDVKFNNIIGDLFQNDDAHPGIKVNCSLFINKDVVELPATVHNEVFRALTKLNFTLGHTNLSVEPSIKKVEQTLKVEVTECDLACGPHSFCKIEKNIPSCQCENGFYKAQTELNETECMESVAISISLRFLRNGYLSLDYERLTRLNNNENILSLKKEAINGMNELFSQSDVSHIYLGSEIVDIKQASLFNADWRSTIVLQFYLYFRKKQTDVKQSQIYRILYNHLRTTKSRLGHSSHLYADINSIPSIPINSAIYGLTSNRINRHNHSDKSGESILEAVECHLDTNQGCGKNADCRVSKGIVKCLCRIGFHSVQQTKDCAEFQIQSVILLVKRTPNYNKDAFRDLNDESGKEIANTIYDEDDFISVITPKMKTILKDPKYNPVFIDMDVKSLGPSIMNNAALNVTLFLRAKEKSTKKRDLDSMIVDLLKDGVGRLDGELIQRTSDPGIYLNDTSYRRRDIRRDHYIVHDNIINFGDQHAQLDFNDIIAYSPQCDLRDSSGCQPNAVCKYVKGTIGCFCNRGFYLWKQFGKCIAYRTFNLLLWIIRKDGESFEYKDYLRKSIETGLNELSNLAKAGVDYTFQFSNFRPFYLDSIVEGLVDPEEINAQWKSGIALNVTILVVKSYPGNLDDVYDELRQALVTSNGELGSTRLIVHTNSLFPANPQGSALLLGIEGSDYARYDVCKTQNNLSCGENSQCTKVSGYARCLCFPGFYLKPGTDRCVAPTNSIIYVRGVRKWIRPLIKQEEIIDKTSKRFQELAKIVQSHVSNILKSSSIKNYFLNSEVNSIINIPASTNTVSSAIFNLTIYITKDYFGTSDDIYQELINAVKLMPSAALNGTNLAIDTNFPGKPSIYSKNGQHFGDLTNNSKKLMTSVLLVSSHLGEQPLLYHKIYKLALRNHEWETELYDNFVRGITEILTSSGLMANSLFVQLENVTDPQLYQRKWKDGLIFTFSINIPNENTENVLEQLLAQLYKLDGTLPGTSMRLDLSSFQCCNDFVDIEQRLSRAVLKVSDQINTKSVTVFAEAEVTLIQLDPEIYHIKYDFITEKIEKREKNIYSKAHINQIHEKIYSIFHNVLTTGKNVKTAGLGAMKFNFTIDFELNLNFGPEIYTFNGNNVSDSVITVIKNAKSGTFLIIDPEALPCCGFNSLQNKNAKRYTVIIRFKPLANAQRKQYTEADFKIFKKSFLNKIERVSTKSGLGAYLKAKDLVAIYHEDQTDISGSETSRFNHQEQEVVLKESQGYGLIGVFVVLISEQYPFSGYKLLLNLNEKLRQNSLDASSIKRYELNADFNDEIPLDFEIVVPRWQGNGNYWPEEIRIQTTILPALEAFTKRLEISSILATSSRAFSSTNLPLLPVQELENKTENTKKYFILLRIARYKSLPLVYKQSYKDARSNDYLNLKKLAEKALDEAYGYSNLKHLYAGSEIQNIQDATDINTEWTNSILLNFTASFKKEYQGAQEEVFKSLINSIIQTGFRVGNSDLYVIADGEGKSNKGETSSSQREKPREVVAKVEFQRVESNGNDVTFVVQKSENGKLYLNDIAYVECDAGQITLLKCEDPRTRCLVRIGLFKNSGPECVCSHGWTRREWIAHQPSSAPSNENLHVCHEYRGVNIMLRVSGIEFRNVNSEGVQLFPNTVEYRRLTGLIMRELTSIFVKSFFRQSFLRLEIINITQDVIDHNYKGVISVLLVQSRIYLDVRFRQSEELIRSRLAQEIELYKRNLDKIGMAMQVVESRPSTKFISISKPVVQRTTTIFPTQRTTKSTIKTAITTRNIPTVRTTTRPIYREDYFTKPNLNSLDNNVRPFMDLADNRIIDKKEIKVPAEFITTPSSSNLKTTMDFLKVSDNKLQDVSCEVGTAIGCSVNEECILNNGRAICRCIFGFAKETNTTTCIEHKTVDVQIRLDSIKNVSLLDLYKGGLIDRKNSNFVHFIMEELDNFVGKSEYAKYIIETRFNNLAKIQYEKDHLSQHILLNFTVMIKKTFEGSSHQIVTSLLSRIRTLKFKLDGKVNLSALPFKDLTSVVQTEDFNFVPDETFETLELQGAACSYEETLICAQNKELCKVINGKPICLCRYGFARPTNSTKLIGSCRPSFYYFIVVRIIRDKDRILNIESLENSFDKDVYMANFEKLGKQALDYTVLSSDLKQYFLNSKFNGITNPKNIDERWKDLGIGLNFTLVLGQSYKGTTRNIAKSLSTVIIKNGYKLPLTDYYVIPLISTSTESSTLVQEEEDIEKYLIRNNVEYASHEIILQPLPSGESQNTDNINLKDTMQKINQDLRSSQLKEYYLGLKLKSYDGLVREGEIQRFVVALYFRKGFPFTLTSVKEIVQLSIGHKFSLFLKNILTSRQNYGSFSDIADRERKSGYLYALEIDVEQSGDLTAFNTESPLYASIAGNFSTAINKIFSKTPLKNGYYQGIKINGITLRQQYTLERSAMINFTIYVSKLQDESFEEISNNILREIIDSNYELDTGDIRIKVKPESLNTYNIGAVSFVVLLSVLKQGDKPLVYSDGLYDKESPEYKQFAIAFMKGVKEVLKGSDMEKYLIGSDINTISQAPAPPDAEAIVNLGVVVNFTLHFTPIFKVSDDQAKTILTKLISQRNYQLGQTDLYISPIPLPPLAQSICLTEPSKGSCTGNFTRWYFDTKTKRCQDFFYSGCQGNDNNFISAAQCLSTCMFYMPRCTLPLDVGLCSQKIIRFYYDESISQCRNFVYTGCGGNFNNFKNWKGCNDQCSEPIKTRFTPKPTTTPEAPIYIIHNRPNAKISSIRPKILGSNVQSFVFPIRQTYETQKPLPTISQFNNKQRIRTVKEEQAGQINMTSWLGLNYQNLDDYGFNPFFEDYESETKLQSDLNKKPFSNRQFQQDFKAETIPIISASPKDEILSASDGIKSNSGKSIPVDIDVFEENGNLYDAEQQQKWVREFGQNSDKKIKTFTNNVIKVQNLSPTFIEKSKQQLQNPECSDILPDNATCDQISLCYSHDIFQKLCGCIKGGEKKKFSETECVATSQYIFYQPMKNVSQTPASESNDITKQVPELQKVTKVFRKEVRETIKNSTLDTYFIGTRVNGFINNSLSQNDGFIVNYTIFMKKTYPGDQNDLKAQLEMALREKLKQTALESNSLTKQDQQSAAMRLNLGQDFSKIENRNKFEKPSLLNIKTYLLSEKKFQNEYNAQSNIVNFKKPPPPNDSNKETSSQTCPKHFIIYQAVRRINNVPLSYSPDLDNKLSDPYKNLVMDAEKGLNSAFQTTSISQYFLSTMVGKFIKGSGDLVIMKVLVCLKDNYFGTLEDVTTALYQAIISRNNNIGESSLYTDVVLSKLDDGSVNDVTKATENYLITTAPPLINSNRVVNAESNDKYVEDTLSLINFENAARRREDFENEETTTIQTTESTQATTASLSVSFLRQTISPFSHIDYRVSLGDKAMGKTPIYQTLLFGIDLQESGIKNALNSRDITNEFNKGLEEVIDKLGLSEYYLNNSINVILTPRQLSKLGLMSSQGSIVINTTINWDAQIEKTKVAQQSPGSDILCQIRGQLNHLIESNGFTFGDTSLKISPRPIGSKPFIMYLAVPFNISSFPLLTDVHELNEQTTEYERFRKTLDIELFQLYFPRKILNYPPTGSNFNEGSDLNYCPEAYSSAKDKNDGSFYMGNRLNSIVIQKGRSGVALFVLNFTIFTDLNFALDFNSVRMDLLNRIDNHDGYLGKTGLKLFLTHNRHALKRIRNEDPMVSTFMTTSLKRTEEPSLLIPLVSASGHPITYSIAYANPQSEEYQILDKEFKHYIDEIFLSSPLRGVYQGVRINGIKPLPALYNTKLGSEKGILINYTVIVYDDGNKSVQLQAQPLRTQIQNLVDASFVVKNYPNVDAKPTKVECLHSQQLCRSILEEPIQTVSKVSYDAVASTVPESAGHADIGQNGYKLTEEKAIAYPLQLTLYKYAPSQKPLYWSEEYENPESVSYKILTEGTKKILDNIFSQAPQLKGRYAGVKVDRLSPYTDEVTGKAYVMFDLVVYLTSNGHLEDNLPLEASLSHDSDDQNNPSEAGFLTSMGQTGHLAKVLYQIIYQNFVPHSTTPSPLRPYWSDITPAFNELYGDLVRSSFVENKFAVDSSTSASGLTFQNNYDAGSTSNPLFDNVPLINSGQIRERIEYNKRQQSLAYGGGLVDPTPAVVARREYLVLLNVLRRNHDALLFHPEFSDGNQRSELYSYVVANSRIGLENIIKNSNLGQFYLSCKVNGILDPEIVNLPSPANGIIVNFTVTFDDKYAGTQENIFNVVSQRLIDSSYNLPGTDLYVDPAPNKVEYELEFNFEEFGIQNLSQLMLHQLINQQQGDRPSEEINYAFRNGIKSVLLKTPLAGYFVDGKIRNIKYGPSGNLTFVLDVLLKPDFPGTKKDLYSAIYTGFEHNPIQLNPNSTIQLRRFRKPVNMNIGVMRLNDRKLTYLPQYQNVNSNEYQNLKDIFVNGITQVISHTPMASKLRAIKMVDISSPNHGQQWQGYTPRHDRFEDFGTSGNGSTEIYSDYQEPPFPPKEGPRFNSIDDGLTITYEADMGKECDWVCENELRTQISSAIHDNYDQIGNSGLFTEPLINKQLTGDQESIDQLTTHFVTRNPHRQTITNNIISSSDPTSSYKNRFNGLNCNEADTFTGCGLNQFCEISTEGYKAVCQCFPGYLKSHADGNCIDSRQVNSGRYYHTFAQSNTRLNIITGTPTTIFASGGNHPSQNPNTCTDKNTANGCGANARCTYRRAMNLYECECIFGVKNDQNDCLNKVSLVTSSSVRISPKEVDRLTSSDDRSFLTFLSTTQARQPSLSPRTFARYNFFTGLEQSTTPAKTTSRPNGVDTNSVRNRNKANPLKQTKTVDFNSHTTPTFTYSATYLDSTPTKSFHNLPYNGQSHLKEISDYPDVKLVENLGENKTNSMSASIYRLDNTPTPIVSSTTQSTKTIQKGFRLERKLDGIDKSSTQKSVLTPDLTIYDNVVKSITYRLTHVANVTGKNNPTQLDESRSGPNQGIQSTVVTASNGYIVCTEDSTMPSGCPTGKKCVVLQKDFKGRPDVGSFSKYAICVCEDGFTPHPVNSSRCIALQGLPEISTISSISSATNVDTNGECDLYLNSGCKENEVCSIINQIPKCKCVEGAIRLYPSSVCVEYVAIPLYLEVLRQGKDSFYYKSPFIDPSSPRSKDLYKKAQQGLNDLMEQTRVSPFFLGSKLNGIYQIYQDKQRGNASISKPKTRTIFNYSLYFNDQKNNPPAPDVYSIQNALKAKLLANRGYLGSTDLYINPKSLNGTGVKFYEIYIHILSKNDRPLQFISAYGDPESWQFKLLANLSEFGLKKTLIKSSLNNFLSVVKLTRIYDGQNFDNKWNDTSVFKFLIGLRDIYPGNSRNISSTLATAIIATNYTLGHELKVNPVSVELPHLAVYDFLLRVNSTKPNHFLKGDELKLNTEAGISKLLSGTVLGNQYFGSEVNGISYINDTAELVGSNLINISIYVPTKYKYSYGDVSKILAEAFRTNNYNLGKNGIYVNEINPTSNSARLSTTSPIPNYRLTPKQILTFDEAAPKRGDLKIKNSAIQDAIATNLTQKPTLRGEFANGNNANPPVQTIVIAPEVQGESLYRPNRPGLKFKKTSISNLTIYRTIPVEHLSTPVTKNNVYYRFLPDQGQDIVKISEVRQQGETGENDNLKGLNYNQNNLEISESLLADLCGLMSCSNGKVCRIIMGQPTCVCKPGFSRKDTGPCFMAKKFSLLVRVLRENSTYLIYTYRYENETSEEYQNLFNKAKTALEDQVQNTKIYPWFIKAPLVKIEDSKKYPHLFKDTSGYKVPILVYNLDIDSTYNGGPDIIRQELMKSIALNNNSLGNSGLYVDPLPLVQDIDECSDPNLNDCHQLATCINTPGRFTCKCLDGYIDNSIDNFDTSGRLCNAPVSDCSEEHCSYHGTCRVDAQQNKRVCDCERWWVGRQCQHSGKLIAIISGFVLCLALLLCCLLPLWFCFQRRRTRRQTENMRWAYDTMSKDTFGGMSSNSDKDTTDSTRIIPSLIIPRARLSEAARSQISSKLKDDTFDDILPTSWDDSFMHIPRPIVAEKNYHPQALALVHESDSRSDRSDTQLINEGSLKGFPKSPPIIESSMEAQVKRARDKIASASEFYRGTRHFDERDNLRSSYGKQNRNANNSNSAASNDNYSKSSTRFGEAQRGPPTVNSSCTHSHAKEEPTTEITEETTTTVEEWTKRYRKSTAGGPSSAAKKMATSTQTDKQGKAKAPQVAQSVVGGNKGKGGIGLSSESTSSSDYSYYEYKGCGDSDQEFYSNKDGNQKGTKDQVEGKSGDRNVAIDYYQEGSRDRSGLNSSNAKEMTANTGKLGPRFKRNNSAMSINGGGASHSAVSKYYRNHKVHASSNSASSINNNSVKTQNATSSSGIKTNIGHMKNFPKRLSSSASDVSTASSITTQAKNRNRGEEIKAKSDDEMLLNLNENTDELMLQDCRKARSIPNLDVNDRIGNNEESLQKRYYFARKNSEYDREEVASLSEVRENYQTSCRGMENTLENEDNFEIEGDVMSDILFKNIPIIGQDAMECTGGNGENGSNKKSKKKMNQMSKIAAEASHVCKAWQRSGRLKQIVSNSGEGTWSSKGNYPEEVASYSEAEGTVRDRKYVRQQHTSKSGHNTNKAQSTDPRTLYNMHYPNQHSNIGYESEDNFKI